MSQVLVATLLLFACFAAPLSANELLDSPCSAPSEALERTPKATNYSPPIALLGLPYSHDIPNPSGTFGPVAWAFAGGSLPPGILFNGSGSIHGVPFTAGGFTFNVNYNDQSNNSGTYTVTLSVLPNLLTGSSQCALAAPTSGRHAFFLGALFVAGVAIHIRRRRA